MSTPLLAIGVVVAVVPTEVLLRAGVVVVGETRVAVGAATLVEVAEAAEGWCAPLQAPATTTVTSNTAAAAARRDQLWGVLLATCNCCSLAVAQTGLRILAKRYLCTSKLSRAFRPFCPAARLT